MWLNDYYGRLIMAHLLSPEDRAFCAQVESFTFPPAAFNHRAHLRLAYVYLSEHTTEQSYEFMRDTLRRFLTHHGVDLSKYHETMTRAWILAVRHFMESTSSVESDDGFIEQNPEMLDSKSLMTHYSSEVIFSDEARATFVEPNLEPIPRYGE